MKLYKGKELIQNSFLYILPSYLLYISIYIAISLQLKGFYTPVFGVVFFTAALISDYILSRRNIRIIIRFLSIVFSYFLLKFLIILFSFLTSNKEGYNIFIDKLPYLFNRDTVIIIILVVFYFIFDAVRIIRVNMFGYIASTIILIASFVLSLSFADSIKKTIFNNYFNLSLFLIFIVTLFIFRHAVFYQNKIGRKFEKKDIFLFIPMIIFLILIFFTIILPDHRENKKDPNSGIFTENLFFFDFSQFLELKEEIKLSDDRVLIMELNGVKDSIKNRINKGWNRQIYLKRFSLEEYQSGSMFKIAEKNLDPYSPPVYVTDYKWQLKDVPSYIDREDIIETLYLINIDPSSLMGSDLLTKVVPITNWDGSPYKQIYKSYCTIFESDFNNMNLEDLNQKKFIKELDPKRKDMLLYWGKEDVEGRIKELAEEITDFYDGTFYKTIAILQYLKENYYYSLRPGIAKGNSQLEYFLFDSKKGYCSYFAFAMTLMLRSVGIASRVVVGFAPDMNEKTLNFYDVRALHGHAWVEVFFDDYGWITFDPTSSNFAPGENFELFSGNKDERDDLIEEILKNKDKMFEVTKEKEDADILKDFAFTLKRSIRVFGLVLFILIFFIFGSVIYMKKKIFIILFHFTREVGLKVNYLFKDMLGKLLDLGYPIHERETILEYSKRIKKENIADITFLTKLYQETLFRKKNKIKISISEINEIRAAILKDLKKLPKKRKMRSFFNMVRLWKKILPVLIFILFNSVNLIPDENKSLEEYIFEAESALSEGYYDNALKLLNEAEIKYPDESLPNFEKGRLYYNRDLYEIAIIEFLKAKEKGFVIEENYLYIADSYGSIGEDKKAVKIMEEAFNNLYQSRIMYEKLSWLYFKTHDTTKGIKKVKEGLERYPDSPDLLMTLGNLYSSIFNYRLSKKYYLDAVKNAYKEEKVNNFNAIAYYNLALLENSFLFFEDSYKSAKVSINWEDRASAHIQLNFLYQEALELENAYNEIIKSSTLQPVTKFPELSLAVINIMSGKIDEAIIVLKKLLANKDFSWMLYFGINKNIYYAEIFKYLSIAYEYKNNQISFNDKHDLTSRLLRPLKKIYYRILTFYYNIKAANLFIKIGEAGIKGGGELEGLYQLYNAYDRIWPSKAYKVLELAEKIETKANPKKQKIYNIKKSIMKKKSSIFYTKNRKKKVLINNIRLLDTKWEKALIAETLLEIIKSSRSLEKERYIDELFIIHPPLLPMNKIKIKMNVSLLGDEYNKNRSKIINGLKKRGIIFSQKSKLKLEISALSNKYCYINIYNNGNIIKSEIINVDRKEKKIYEELALNIFNKMFITSLE